MRQQRLPDLTPALSMVIMSSTSIVGLRKRKGEESQITIIDSLVPGNPELDLSVNLIGSEVLPNCHHHLPVRAVWGSCKWIKISTPEIRAGPGVETDLGGGMVTGGGGGGAGVMCHGGAGH